MQVSNIEEVCRLLQVCFSQEPCQMFSSVLAGQGRWQPRWTLLRLVSPMKQMPSSFWGRRGWRQSSAAANKGPSSQSYGFSSSHVWIWELDYKESWAPKNWWFWTVVLEKTLESPVDWKESQPVHPEGNQSWIFTRKTDAEAETPILWPPDAKNWLIGKDPDAGKDWGQVEKGTTEDEMVGWHHRRDGHEFE